MIVGSNDLSQNKTTKQVLQELVDLSQLISTKFKDCTLNISPLFHRLGKYRYNSQVDEINKKLLDMNHDNILVMKNRHITSRSRHLFEDGIHFSKAGTIELARMIKTNVNEQLGLKPYQDYSFNEPLTYDSYHMNDDYKQYPHYHKNYAHNQNIKPLERDIIMRLLGM